MLRPPGDLLESFVEQHLSDPSWDEANEAFGGLSKPSGRLEGVIRNVSLATSAKVYRGGFVLPSRRNFGTVERPTFLRDAQSRTKGILKGGRVTVASRGCGKAANPLHCR